jgi:hypothetical protein
MRLLFGMVLGALITVGAAYFYDSNHGLSAAQTPAQAQRPLVNWDVVAVKWDHLTAKARREWHRLVPAS